MSTGKLDCHGVTDPGRQRNENEDQFLIADLVKAVRVQTTSLSHDDHTEVTGHSQGKIFLVADGIGSQAAGRRASTLAVDETIDFMVNRMRWSAFSGPAGGEEDDETLLVDLKAALKYCQQRILNEAKWDPQKQGMGTALTIAILDWPSLRIVHAGTCQCFLDHRGNLLDLTPAPIRQDEVPPAELSQESTAANLVGGATAELEPEIYDAELTIGDTLLLCTDGLTKHVRRDAIAKTLGRDASARQICTDLVELANAGDGTDNITVVVARFLDPTSTPKQLEAEVALQPPKPKKPEEAPREQAKQVASETRAP